MESSFKYLQGNLAQIKALSCTYNSALAQLGNSVSLATTFRDPFPALFEQERKLFNSTAAILSNARAIHEMTTVSRNLSAANLSLSTLLETAGVNNASLSKMFAANNPLSAGLAKLAQSANVSDLLSHADMTRLFQTSIRSQVQLAKLESAAFGHRIDATRLFSNDLVSSLGIFTQSYRALFEHLPQITESQIPFVAEYATVEYSRELDVLEQLSIEDGEPAEVEVIVQIDDVIRSANGDLIGIINGARQSLQSDNPDKARHVTTSVREMMTQILHRLAPDEDVRKWSNLAEHYSKDRPTRRARLLFICRHFSSGPLDKFVELDVNAVIKLFDALNGGTHVVTSKLTEPQLHAIVCRAESLAFFLLRVAVGG